MNLAARRAAPFNASYTKLHATCLRSFGSPGALSTAGELIQRATRSAMTSARINDPRDWRCDVIPGATLCRLQLSMILVRVMTSVGCKKCELEISRCAMAPDDNRVICEAVRISATSCQFTCCPYHHSGGDGNTSTAVCVGHDVAETDAQERDGDEPHGVEEICVFLIMIPAMTK